MTTTPGTIVRINTGYRRGCLAVISHAAEQDGRERREFFWLTWPEGNRPDDKRGRERDAGWYSSDEFDAVTGGH